MSQVFTNNLILFAHWVFTGDNLLTAINVARDCDMLPVGEKVILVTAIPPMGNNHPTVSVTYSLAEMYDSGPSVLDEHLVLSDETDPMFTDSWPESIFQPMESMARIWRRQVFGSTDNEDRERGMIPQPTPPRIHFALAGRTLDVIRKHCPDLLPRILCRATVLARMTPDRKTRVTLVPI